MVAGRPVVLRLDRWPSGLSCLTAAVERAEARDCACGLRCLRRVFLFNSISRDVSVLGAREWARVKVALPLYPPFRTAEYWGRAVESGMDGDGEGDS